MRIGLYKGNLVAHVNINNKFIEHIPEEYIDNQKERDDNSYHITIIFKDEYNISTFEKKEIFIDKRSHPFHIF